MYEDIFNFASEDDLLVTAEVNTKPVNQGSIRFHEYMGFKEVGQRSFDDHDVAYFEANPTRNKNVLNPRIHVEFSEIINPRSQLNDLDKDIHTARKQIIL